MITHPLRSAKQPLTIEEHRQASEILLGIDRSLSDLTKLLSGRRLKARVLDRVLKVDRLTWSVRSELEDLLTAEQRRNPRARGLYFDSGVRQ